MVVLHGSMSPGYSRLSVLWTCDRKRDRQWTRQGDGTAPTQQHPGVAHSANRIWWLLAPEFGLPPVLLRGKRVCVVDGRRHRS